MFENFQKFVPQAARQFGVGRQIEASHVCQIFRKLIPEFFPKNQKDLLPAHFKEGILTVKVSSAGWAQELNIKKVKILKKINSEIPNQTKDTIVKDLKILTNLSGELSS